MSYETIRKITDNVKKEFGELNNVQLNWKNGESSWSIAQVLEHIIVSNRRYMEVLKKAGSDKFSQTFWEKINPFTRYTGRNMIKNLGPDIQKKYVTPMLFRPSKNMISQDIIPQFIKMQDDLSDLFNHLLKINATGRVITSPVANLITLNVADTMELIATHEERHLKQAMNIKNSIDFPA